MHGSKSATLTATCLTELHGMRSTADITSEIYRIQNAYE